MTTAAQLALAQRRKMRTLPSVDVPSAPPELSRSLESIKEHLRMYEGDSNAPKERFVTLAELENAGLVTADTKNRFSYIAQVAGSDVAAPAGNRTVIVGGGGVASFNSRTGAVVPQQIDYDSFFLTPAEGDAAYAPIGSGVISFNTRTGAVTPQQSDYDSFFLTPAEGDAAYAPLSHSHILTDVTDVTAVFGELNLLDLAGLTVGDVLSADSATTASWKAAAGGGGFAFDTFDYTFDTDINVTDPGSGGVKLNSATPNSVTSVSISETDANSNDLILHLGRMTDGSMVRVIDPDDSTIWQNYIITANTDNGTWRNLQVNPAGNSGTIAADSAPVKVQLRESPYVANPTVENALYYGEPGLAGSPVNGLIEYPNLRVSGQPNGSILEFWDEGGHRWDINVNNNTMTIDAVDAAVTSFVVRSDFFGFQSEVNSLARISMSSTALTLSHQNIAHADALVMYIHETDAAKANVVDYGQIWVLNAGNHLMYTNESGVTTNLSNASESGTTITSGWSTGSGGSGGSFTIGANAPLFLEEQADDDTPGAGFGQIWVKSDIPNTLWFTDDAGGDWQLGLGGGGIDDGTTTNAVLKWSGSAWVEDTSYLLLGSGVLDLTGGTPQYRFSESDATAGNVNWMVGVAVAESFTMRVYDDVWSTSTSFLTVERTANVVDSLSLAATSLNFSSAATVNIGPSGNMNLSAGGAIQVLTASPFRWYQPDNTQYIQIVASEPSGVVNATVTGSEIGSRFIFGTNIDIDINDGDLNVYNSGLFRLRDSDGDFTTLQHDGTNLVVQSAGSGGGAVPWLFDDVAVDIGGQRLRLIGDETFPGAASGESFLYTDTTLGLTMYGEGSSYDFLLANKSGSTVLRIPTGTQDLEGFGDFETVKGTFTQVVSGLNNSVNMVSNGPGIYWHESDQGVGSKGWKMYAAAGVLLFYTTNDSGTATGQIKRVERSGTTVQDQTWFWGAQESFQTQDRDATGNTAGIAIRDHIGTLRDGGYNDLKIKTTNTSETLSAEHAGGVWYNNSTAKTLTMPTSSDLDFPIYAMVTCINHSDNNMTIDGTVTGMTLIWQDGITGSNTGDRTLGPRGVCNIWRHSSGAMFIWGIGLT